MKAFGENIDEKVTTPTYSHLFTVKKQAHQLDEEKSKHLHSVVAKLLYIMKRTRPDLETEMSFLCRRVSKSDEENW